MSKTPLSEKSNFAVAFLAAFLAAGIFKDELAKEKLDVLFWNPTYLSIAVFLGILMLTSVYFYAFQYFIRDLGATANKLSGRIRTIADGLYGLAIAGPVIILIAVVVDLAISLVGSTTFDKKFANILSTITGVLSGVFIVYLSRKRKQEYEKYKMELEKAEFTKLYYEESSKLPASEVNQYKVLHLFKELELILKSRLDSKGYQTYSVPFTRMLEYAIKEGIITKQLRLQIEDFRGLRNKIAHFDTKLDSRTTRRYVRQLKDVINEIEEKPKKEDYIT